MTLTHKSFSKKACLMASLLVFALCGPAAPVNGQNLDSLYRRLDNAIKNSGTYVRERRARIHDLQKRLADAADNSERLEVSLGLYNEYLPFRTDSARFYLDRSRLLAKETGDMEGAALYNIGMAYLNASTGYYSEAMRIMDGIDPSKLSGNAIGHYCTTMNYLYGELAYYTPSEETKGKYYELQDYWFSRMEETLPHDDDMYLQRKELNFYAQNRIEEALRINDERMKRTGRDDRKFAVVAFYRYLDCKAAGDSLEAVRWITEASICDVEHAVMDQGAMWELANLLMGAGEIERSYKYISFAWECAEFYGTRLRNWQISPVLSKIEKSYGDALSKKNRTLMGLTTALFLLIALLTALMFYVNGQRRKLAMARRQLIAANGDLSSANSEIKAVNDELSRANAEQKVLNEQLLSLNAELSESNKVKEEYIGRFLQLCGMYIDKMDAMRKRVNKMIRLQNVDALRSLANASEFTEKELDDLYSSFDSAFLHLFPNFVTDFNELLKPEERIRLTDKNRLNTQLRIFALIRLGIEDSSKIAEFLHYSVNTIYNYRARIKNGAAGDREMFENQVKQIGMPK